MVLTVVPIAINVLTGVALWMSGQSLLPKIIVTIILSVKYGLYFYTALMNGEERVKSFGLIICALINALLALYFAFTGVWYGTVGCAVLAILALVTGSILGFSIKKEE